MSENAGSESAPAPKPDVKPEAKAKPRPEFSHPVLRAMGIPRLRLPTRNWTIFFAVTGLFFGGITYDRKRREAIREQLKNDVKYLSEIPIEGLELPRKVTVYMAPPPSDQIDITQKHWRRNIKPILTAAAIDFDIVEEDKQGHIRTVVAENVRNQRRAEKGLPTTGYTPDELDLKINDKTKTNPSGGVICLGRGAYKEYMTGLHEGWMGPLEEPQFVKDERARIAEEKRKAAEEKRALEAAENGESVQEDEMQKIDIPEPERKGKNDGVEDDTPLPLAKESKTVYPTWLPSDKYSESEVDPLFYQTKMDPILVVRNPHLLGFFRTPQRFGRYMTRRNYFKESGNQAKALVLEQTRPFTAEDVDAAIIEEEDWPNKWKQKGLDKNSEWMREFKVDDRIASRLEMYDVLAAPRATPKPNGESSKLSGS